MKPVIERFQYLTQDFASISHATLAERACQAGARWVQFRSKSLSGETLRCAAAEVVAVCREYQVTCIINDSPQLAKLVGADGVHLGQGDMPVAEARKFLGDDAIIGGTANRLEQALQLVVAGADYLGIGPYRFTTTKENLSPVLGYDGIKKIVSKLDSRVPCVAIGGITPQDVPRVLEAGVHGVAVAGQAHVLESIENMKYFLQQIYSEGFCHVDHR